MLHQRMPVWVDLDATHVEETALGVTAHRVLDLNDVCAPVGKDGARGRDERELRNFQDPKARHHLDHISSHRVVKTSLLADSVKCHR